MILADDILAARGTMVDVGGGVTSLAKGIERAQRFVLSDDAAMAGHQLIRSKPSSLLEAMPMCRLPYQTMWLEWDGASSTRAGFDRYPSTEEKLEDRFSARPVPQRMGCLIEAVGDSPYRGSMTWAWKHDDPDVIAVNVCGLSVNFDWSPDGDVMAWGRSALAGRDPMMDLFFDKWVRINNDDEAIKNVMRSNSSWRALANNPCEVEALRALLRHEAPWFSRHAIGMINLLLTSGNPKAAVTMLKSWEGDIAGESPFIAAVIMMMNSRRAVEHEPNDISKLNKARVKRGKPPFLTHAVTRLHLSHRRIQNAEAHGFSREQARLHRVRGHFKIRKSGVYWWTPFMRGDVERPALRDHYKVVS